MTIGAGKCNTLNSYSFILGSDSDFNVEVFMNEDLSKSVKTVKNPFYIVNDALNDGDAVTVKLTCADSSKECKIHVIQESISGLQWQSYVTALSNGEITFNKKEIGKAISFASSNTIKVKGAPVCTFI